MRVLQTVLVACALSGAIADLDGQHLRGSFDARAPAERRLQLGLGAWMTGPFGKCSRSCDPPVKSRSVICLNVYNGNLTHSCNIIEPVVTVECSCELEECPSDVTVEDCEPSPEEHPPSQVDAPSVSLYANVGCFGLAGDDSTSEGDTMDMTCMDYEGPNQCRSGLPFFRNTTALTGDSCAHFCFGNGLDIFAIVEEKECRCGASVLNGAVWQGKDARPKLLFDPWALTPEDFQDVCPMEVFRFAGIYHLGSLPISLMRPNLATTAYIDSIVRGGDVKACRKTCIKKLRYRARRQCFRACRRKWMVESHKDLRGA